jgi:hypothetical protein
VPTPEQFDNVQRRLHTAWEANRLTNGEYSAVVTQLQGELAALEHTAITAYTRYTAQTAEDLAGQPDDSIQLVSFDTPLPAAPII